MELTHKKITYKSCMIGPIQLTVKSYIQVSICGGQGVGLRQSFPNGRGVCVHAAAFVAAHRHAGSFHTPCRLNVPQLVSENGSYSHPYAVTQSNVQKSLRTKHQPDKTKILLIISMMRQILLLRSELKVKVDRNVRTDTKVPLQSSSTWQLFLLYSHIRI